MRLNRSALRIVSVFLCSGVLYAEELRIHRVESHETLSLIAKKYLGKPIYGDQEGSLAKLKRFNPQIHDIHLIFPGQIIFLQPKIQRQLTSAPTDTVEQIPPPQEEPPTPAPLSTESPLHIPEQEVDHQVLISPSYQMTTLSAVDLASNASANLFSNHDLSLSAAWKQKWTAFFSSMFSAKLRSIDFMPSTNVSKSLSGNKKTTTELAIQTEYRLTSSFSLSLGAAYGSELFLHGADSSTVVIDAVPIPSAQLGMDFEIYQKAKTSLNLSGHFKHLFSASTDSYTVNSGKVYFGALSLHRRYDQEKKISLILGYQERSQETSLIRLREKNFSGSLLFTLPLFGGDQK